MEENQKKKIQYAERFVKAMMQGIDPVTKKTADSDTFQRDQIRNCFQFILEILTSNESGNISSNNKSPKFDDGFMTATEIAKLISEEKKGNVIPAYVISNWMLEQGYLKDGFDTQGKKTKVPSDIGTKMGIVSKNIKKKSGESFALTLYGRDARELILKKFGK